MTNKDLIEILDKNFSVTRAIGGPLLRMKEEDFKLKVENLLQYLDCNAYTDEVRTGFRIFARELLKLMKDDDRGSETKE